MSISLAQATRQVFWYRAVGWFLRIAGAFIFGVWCLRNLYELFRFYTHAALFGNLYTLAVNLIARLYHAVPGVPTVWNHAPFWNLFRPFDTSNLPGAMYLGFCIGLVLWGTGFVQAATNLSRNIKGTKDEIQREQWKETQRPSYREQTVNADTIIQMQIYLSSEDKWWTRPKGILGLAIIGAVIATLIAQWLMLRLGWVHCGCLR